VIDESSQRAMKRRSLDDVVVVEDQSEIFHLSAQEVIGQQRHHGFRWRGLRAAQELKSSLPQLGIDRLQGGDQVGEKAHGVVVLRLEREPGHWRSVLDHPLSQQGRFAKTGTM
jgi:hypothetical protein